MRILPTLLLLLLLPGLLLPAGLIFDLCRCASTDAATLEQTVPSCCATAAVSCCSRTKAPRAPGEEVASTTACACGVLATPDHKPDPAAPHPGTNLDFDLPFAYAGEVAIVLPLAFVGRMTCDIAQSRPPPPGHQRNLPLLL